MPTTSTLLVFAAAGLALLLVPGPAVLYIVTRSVSQGRGAGLVSVLGVHVGSVVHVAAAALGLSALLASSATAFAVVRYAGAAYLVWLGVQKLRSRGHVATPTGEPAAATRGRLFAQGIVVNVLNPKTALFFLAFLPQFVHPDRGPVAVQILVLGACFIGLGMLSDSGYAVLAGALAGRLRRTVRARRRLDRASGVVFLGLGAGAALAGNGNG
jgi:threonine/homoserine/homoserine lactone efflux protein